MKTKRRNKNATESFVQLSFPFFTSGFLSDPQSAVNYSVGDGPNNNEKLQMDDWESNGSLKEAILREAAGKSLSIIYTNNRSRIISFKDEKEGKVEVRISNIMKKASLETWRELGLWINNPRDNQILSEGTHSGRFIQLPRIKKLLAESKRKRSRRLIGLGQFFNLNGIFDNFNAKYFDGNCDAKVGWSRRPISRARHSIQLGCYYGDDNYILINPVLDWERVPLMVVEGTIFHEMVHWRLRYRNSNSKRRRLHTKEFEEMMRQWPLYEEYENWVKQNSSMLIRRRNFLSRKKDR